MGLPGSGKTTLANILAPMFNAVWLNADQVRKSFMDQQVQKTACTTCADDTVLPVKTILNCSPTGCNYQLNDPNGLGQGRNFQ